MLCFRVMVSAYLGGLSLDSKQIDGIVNFYLAVKQEAANKLTDGTGKRPTYRSVDVAVPVNLQVVVF